MTTRKSRRDSALPDPCREQVVLAVVQKRMSAEEAAATHGVTVEQVRRDERVFIEAGRRALRQPD